MGDPGSVMPVGCFALLVAADPGHRALVRGGGWVNANLGNDSYFKLVAGFTKIDPAIAAKMVLEPASTSISAAQIQPMVKLMRDNGLIAGDIDLRTKMFV